MSTLVVQDLAKASRVVESFSRSQSGLHDDDHQMAGGGIGQARAVLGRVGP